MDLQRTRENFRNWLSNRGGLESVRPYDYDSKGNRIVAINFRTEGGGEYYMAMQDLLALALEPRQPDNTELRQLQDEFCTDLYTKRVLQPGDSIQYLPEDSARVKRIYELLHPLPPKSLEQRTMETINRMLEPGSPADDDDKAVLGRLADEWEARLSQTP